MINDRLSSSFTIFIQNKSNRYQLKAKTAGSSVIYFQDKKIIEENPLTLKKTVVAAKADY